MNDDTDTLAEIAAYIAAHAEDIPRHRRRQAVLILKRCERLIPVPDQLDQETP